MASNGSYLGAQTVPGPMAQNDVIGNDAGSEVVTPDYFIPVIIVYW